MLVRRFCRRPHRFRAALLTVLLAPAACGVTPEEAPQPEPPEPVVKEPFTQTIRGTDVKFDMVPVPEGGFWIGKTEVTWDEYLLFCDFANEGKAPPAAGVDGVSKPSKPLDDVTPYDPYWGTGRRPAVGMSRNGAIKYCEWLSRNTGRRFRLPTEAEWELACGPAPSGDITEYAWVATNSEEMTQEVGTRKPNHLGIHDMLGNLWEYCSDPFSAEEPERAVMRGGAWEDEPASVTPKSRLGFDDDWILADPNVPAGVWWVPDGDHLGFRIVCDDVQ